MWTKEQIRLLVSTKKFAVAAASAMSLAGGMAAGYTIAQKKLKAQYEEAMAKEIEETKTYYSRLHKTGDFADPIEVLKQYAGDIIEDSEYAPTSDDNIFTKDMEDTEPDEIVEVEVEVTEEVTISHIDEEAEPQENVVKNVFAGREPVIADDWDYMSEIAERDENFPYIIHHDEYFGNETDYEQTSLTYFAGDDVLLDDRDEVIPDPDETVGESNLDKFGKGSKDNNIVYIRNDKMEMDFEVVRHEGNYVKNVLGFDQDALEHSDRRGKSRRFRHDDG